MSESKYQPGREIGRGGLSRVIEAQDREIGRQVALKLLLEGAPLHVVERFRREGRITGRLEHPNIVPVYDVGTLPGDRPEVYFAMKKVGGRDMGSVLRGLRRGGADWTQRRLVEALRDVCRAVAYAHSKGVIHRDLKPSNVMLGEFGEVLVVDWGLAHESSQVPGPRSQGEARHGAAEGLTLDGDVVGTPEYMSPEQAQGRTQDVDERSDVYALGAILYEILTWRPPFTGDSVDDVLESARTSTPVAPSASVGAAASRPDPAAPSSLPGPGPVPPELEAVCLRAIAREPERRFASAAALQETLDAWLSGDAERERRARLAAEKAAEARGHLARWRELLQAERDALAEALKAAPTVERHSGVEGFRRIWEPEDRSEAAAREAVRAFASADAALAAALSMDPQHAEARALKAEAYAERHRKAELWRDEGEMLFCRSVIERHDDGRWAEWLRGDGTLEVRTRAYPCACLREGRVVTPAELSVGGYRPWSGLRADGSAVEGLPEHEMKAPRRLRVHAAACATEARPGTAVWAFAYESVDRTLRPVTRGASERPIPAAVLDELFGDSPYRPTGGGVWLGETPVARRRWPMGPGLLVVVPPGGTPARVPFLVGRGEDVALDVTVFGRDEVPPGHVPIAGGRFLYSHVPGQVPGNSDVAVEVDDAFLARDPVTCGDYLQFLNDLHQSDPAAAARHAPRESDGSPPFWSPGPAGYSLTPPPPRLPYARGDWRQDWPALALAWRDAMAFAAWASRADRSFVHALPDEIAFERASRSPDARPFPWGERFAECFANVGGSRPGGNCPAPVGTSPYDESAWGVRDFAGNVSQLLINEGSSAKGDRRAIRGGRWNAGVEASRLYYRSTLHINDAAIVFGFRLSAPVRLSGPDSRPELNWRRGVSGKR